MDEQRYILLLNHCLKKHMVGMNRKEKERLREKFEFLETGIWDSGVRVKKLKGVWGKVIFEARLSRGERIIFTLGKHGSKTIIYASSIVTTAFRRESMKMSARMCLRQGSIGKENITRTRSAVTEKLVIIKG